MESTLALVSRRLPPFGNYDALRDIQVLAPMKKGDLGVNRLNTALQEVFNPQDGTKNEVKSGETLFRVGDKVMQVKNNYSLKWIRYGVDEEEGEGVFNGDIGFILEIDVSARMLTIEFDDARRAEYEFALLDELQPAYAVSIHKSQGSEFPVVVLPLVSGPPMLFNRNLLYTAITRARELVVITGREECVRAMVENNRTIRRFSGLPQALGLLKDAAAGD